MPNIDAVQLFKAEVKAPGATGAVQGRFLVAAYDRDQAKWIAETWWTDRGKGAPSVKLTRMSDACFVANST